MMTPSAIRAVARLAAACLLLAAGSLRAAAAAGEPPAAPPATSVGKEPEQPRLTYGGSADFYFSSGLNDPFNGRNALRAWDYKDEHGPHLGLIDLWVEHRRGPIGGRLDLNFGPTAHRIHSTDPAYGTLWDHIEEAYVSANLDRKGRTYVDLGKWASTAGLEVIEPKDNWLTTTGLVFNVLQPTYHVGARAYHYLNETDYVLAAVHRGWNTTGDPHHAPGFALAYNTQPRKEVTLTVAYYGGEEPAVPRAREAYRGLLDVIVVYEPDGSRWAFTCNLDGVMQRGARAAGVAAQARYRLTTRSWGTLRGEAIADDGFLGVSAYTLTAGYAYRVTENFETRVEARSDWADRDAFPLRTRGSFSDSQPTLLLSAIVSF